ncbi:MAG: hypothetical protein LWY06_04600 [Firmicutes bacterium]|nr:hypothetical protein [Bacillota bacterium]
MLFWKKPKQEPREDSLTVTIEQLDNILTLLRYWYGVEADHWINSEASRYTLVMSISGFRKKGDMRRLHDYFAEAVSEAKKLKESDDPIEQLDYIGTYGDFLHAQVNVTEAPKGTGKSDILEIRKMVTSCRVHYPINNWFFYTDEKQYHQCDVKVGLIFEAFGEGGQKNGVMLTTKIIGEHYLELMEMESTHKKFGSDIKFLKEGLDVLEEIDNRIAEKYRLGKRPERYSPRTSDWFVFECASEDEALIFQGVNETLGIESFMAGKKVEFKMEEFDIPGLISYLRVGLPHYIFTP